MCYSKSMQHALLFYMQLSFLNHKIKLQFRSSKHHTNVTFKNIKKFTNKLHKVSVFSVKSLAK